jgi:hypothetical protein
VFLASERAKAISGQVFGVRRNEIYLFSQPRPVKTLHRAEGWTPETIAETLPGAFKDSLTPLEGTAEFFNWEPV